MCFWRINGKNYGEMLVRCNRCSSPSTVHRVYNTISATDRTEKLFLSQLRKNDESSRNSSDTENSDIVPMFDCIHLLLGLSNRMQM